MTRKQLRSKTGEFSFMLRSSRIEGIGVFATHAIQKGTYLALFPDEEEPRMRRVNKTNEKFVPRYGIHRGGKKYLCPVDFRRMSIGWYLNHSESPSASHMNYRFFATKNIGRGEEITIDYGTL